MVKVLSEELLLLIDTVLCMYKVTPYNFSSNGDGRKNYLGPLNLDILHQPLCEDSDKIPEDRTSIIKLSISLDAGEGAGRAESDPRPLRPPYTQV